MTGALLQTSICNRIMEDLRQDLVTEAKRQVVTISLESFYVPLTTEQQDLAQQQQFNLDHPGCIVLANGLSYPTHIALVTLSCCFGNSSLVL